MSPTLEASPCMPTVEDFSVKTPEMPVIIPDEGVEVMTNGGKSNRNGLHVNRNPPKSKEDKNINNIDGQSRSYSMPILEGGSSSSDYIPPTPPATPFPQYEDHYIGEVPQHHSLPIPQTTESTRPRAKSYTTSKPYPRISRPVELLRNEYDVVVIGSGYGGAVAASRFARAGESVCLLERGREKWPGEYPTGTIDALKQLHVSGNFAPGIFTGTSVEEGDPTGLYHLIVGEGQNAFVGNGLGGTSLLNANVFLRADEHTLSLDEWPIELRKQKGWLNKYYDRAEEVLEPNPYPEGARPLKKLDMLERQFRDIQGLVPGAKFSRVPQTTRFTDGPNSTGVNMRASTLSGMDCTGVNDCSKSSTLVNYLSDAWNWGAEMFCSCEVRHIKEAPDGGYLIFFAWHGSGRGAFKENIYEDLMWVRAKKVVALGAGSIGTTEILLRSKQQGMPMSDNVGTGMSGNGDMLAFGYNTDEEVNAIGRQYPRSDAPVGPTITGLIDCREGWKNPLDGFIIEEGAIPQALAPFLQTMLSLMPGKIAPKGLNPLERLQHLLARQGSKFLGPYYREGSIEKTQVYLIMSHDSAQAELTLKNDKPCLVFTGVGQDRNSHKLIKVLQKATQAVGGTFVQNPFTALAKQEITVHPIGGACMSRDGTGNYGVTNQYGEVFTGRGAKTYQGLIVTDAAVIPTALGANPFATITALAERSVEHQIHKLDLTVSQQKNGYLKFVEGPAHPCLKHTEEQVTEAEQLIKQAFDTKASGIVFSEVMSGFIHPHDNDQYGEDKESFEVAAKTARGLCESARFFLSCRAWNTDVLVNDDGHKAMLTGTFVCAALPGSPFMVQRGDFQLFNLDLTAPETKNMTYTFEMTSTTGEKVFFHGCKIVNPGVTLNPFSLWRATSTLYVTLRKNGPGGPVLAKGILHIKPGDFASQVLTIRPTGRTLLAKTLSTVKFVTYFATQAANVFLSPITLLQFPTMSSEGFQTYTHIYETYYPLAEDGFRSVMTRYEPKKNNYAKGKDGEPYTILMIPGASVDHQIYATPTIKYNAVDFFREAGYRVYVNVTRIGKTVSENNYTTYDARQDIRAALEEIHKIQGKKPIYVIAHCMGSVAFSCGLLDETIPAHWVKGITASAVFMNPKWATINLAKALFPIPLDQVYKAAAGDWYSCNSSRGDSLVQQFINQALRFYPVAPSEICNSVTCHRASFVFGRLWNHANLNHATHGALSQIFGGINMTLMHLLMQMGERGYVCANAPLFENLVTPENIQHLKGIPIFLFSGADNKTLTPESTEKSLEQLREELGEQNGIVQRHVFDGYGHLDPWMGQYAYRDIWPKVLAQVEKAVKG